MYEIIYGDDRKNRTVKNLRWLIQRKREVNHVEVSPQSHFMKPLRGFAVRLIATLTDGRKFRADFADAAICRTFVTKRNWSVTFH